MSRKYNGAASGGHRKWKLVVGCGYVFRLPRRIFFLPRSRPHNSFWYPEGCCPRVPSYTPEFPKPSSNIIRSYLLAGYLENASNYSQLSFVNCRPTINVERSNESDWDVLSFQIDWTYEIIEFFLTSEPLVLIARFDRFDIYVRRKEKLKLIDLINLTRCLERFFETVIFLRREINID